VKLAELRVEQEGQIVYASLRGDIDMSNAGDLRGELSRATPNAALGLVLDLSGVDYLDSAGIHLVHHLREDLHSSGQRLALIIPEGSPVNAALRLAGLDWTGETADTIEGARDAVRHAKQT
jgi:anti-anti-sigma factor